MPMKYDEDVKRRLRRVEGQVRGVLKMMEEEKNCKDVVSQLSAVRNAVDKAIAYIVAVNLEQCILEEKEAGKDTGKLVQEAVELLIKSR
ncbi:metal-sensitive transcriptional regulator [Aneurinibacillus thermoaerophilus]|uniref:metal-sensitive transcriptional regulator n=1 Tax=Aneurinibacillus thermoaerophilus TaxID=143495 RepID=UPI002E245D21|nr:metal-sensitive transcriptional regulator [Aneurinibacillus thermoaerophilus]MED0763809.1 metal-sensitive transcriptional regulator [Aneurinibacillus thermoaerophilus]